MFGGLFSESAKDYKIACSSLPQQMIRLCSRQYSVKLCSRSYFLPFATGQIIRSPEMLLTYGGHRPNHILSVMQKDKLE